MQTLRSNLFKVSNYYMLGSRKCNIIHTRLRHQCSSLGADLFRANIVNDPSCPCGCPLELTDENNLIVFKNVIKYIHHTNKLYSVLRMLSIHLHSTPFPPPLLFIKYIMYTFIIYVTCCHFHI